MATPTLKAVTPPAGPTPSSAEPVIIYDLPAGGGGSTAWADVTGVPVALTTPQPAATPSVRAIGTTATSAAAGNHTHTFTTLTGAVTDATGANLQLILNDLAARIKALETT